MARVQILNLSISANWIAQTNLATNPISFFGENDKIDEFQNKFYISDQNVCSKIHIKGITFVDDSQIEIFLFLNPCTKSERKDEIFIRLHFRDYFYRFHKRLVT